MRANKAGTARFEEVTAGLREDIRSGKYRPGDKLPTQRELVSATGFAVATVQKALQVLEDEGWIVKRASVGIFVADDVSAAFEPRRVTDRLTAVEMELAQLRKRMSQLEGSVAQAAEEGDDAVDRVASSGDATADG
ncbi:GntR family transcriptional regulator [Amycolatopsis sp. NPDC059090]|uniref:GntR family transcriptional regulator n=1 Tax=unclassified Amycolatopsis TaxID=2618356 RepID=UPI00366E78A6